MGKCRVLNKPPSPRVLRRVLEKAGVGAELCRLGWRFAKWIGIDPSVDGERVAKRVVAKGLGVEGKEGVMGVAYCFKPVVTFERSLRKNVSCFYFKVKLLATGYFEEYSSGKPTGRCIYDYKVHVADVVTPGSWKVFFQALET